MILLDTHTWVRWLIPAAALPDWLVAHIESSIQIGVRDLMLA